MICLVKFLVVFVLENKSWGDENLTFGEFYDTLGNIFYNFFKFYDEKSI